MAEPTQQHKYQGRITSVHSEDGTQEYNVHVDFTLEDKILGGLFIPICYKFYPYENKRELVYWHLKDKLESHPEGVRAEVILDKPVNQLESDYEGKGLIRFLEEESKKPKK